MQAGFALPGRGLQPDGERRIPDLMLNLHQPHGNGEYRFIFRSPRRGAMLLRSSSWRPKFISVIAWGRDVRCGRPLGDRNSFRSSRGGAMFVAVVLLETEIHFGRRVGGRRFIPAVQEPAPPVLQQPAGQASEARQSGRKRRFCPALMRQNRVVSACRQQSGRSAHCAAAENPP
jgi:hypothetical protein